MIEIALHDIDRWEEAVALLLKSIPGSRPSEIISNVVLMPDDMLERAKALLNGAGITGWEWISDEDEAQ